MDGSLTVRRSGIPLSLAVLRDYSMLNLSFESYGTSEGKILAGVDTCSGALESV